MGVLPIWIANALRLAALVSLKALFASVIVFTIDTPLQSFGSTFLAYWLGTWCWACFAHWVSLLIPNQVTVMMILVLAPTFENFSNGKQCNFQWGGSI